MRAGGCVIFSHRCLYGSSKRYSKSFRSHFLLLLLLRHFHFNAFGCVFNSIWFCIFFLLLSILFHFILFHSVPLTLSGVYFILWYFFSSSFLSVLLDFIMRIDGGIKVIFIVLFCSLSVSPLWSYLLNIFIVFIILIWHQSKCVCVSLSLSHFHSVFHSCCFLYFWISSNSFR